MGKIQYPPPGAGQGDVITKQCFIYGEELEIQFGASGLFSHDNNEAFNPDPPTGNFVAPPSLEISQYYAIHQDSVVTFTFVDTANGETYQNQITIVASRDLCPKDSQS
jgi:hypothetical protein